MTTTAPAATTLSTTAVNTPRRRHATPEAASAIDLVARAYAEHKTLWITSNLQCRVSGDDATATIALNGYTLWTGPAETVDTARAELEARLATATDPSHPMFSRGGYMSVDVDRMADFWRGPELASHVMRWLRASLGPDSDDAAHCAMEIAGLVGHRRWMAYADASTNVRTGIVLPRTHCITAAADKTDLDALERDCDALAIREALDSVDRLCGSRIREMPRRRKPYAVCVSLCAVYVAPGLWDLARAPYYKSRGLPPVDSDCLARLFATERRHQPFANVSLYVDDCIHACVGVLSAYMDISLSWTRVDRDGERTKALVNAARLSRSSIHAHDIEAIGPVADAAVSARRANGTLDAWVPPDVSWIARLREALHNEDSSRLRLCVGECWDAAVPDSCIICVDHSFVADAHGVWRNSLGAATSWDDLVKFADAKPTRHPSAFVVVSDKRIDLHFARDDPRYVPEFAYRLCCDALSGDRRAVDWLGVLGLASAAWAMLDETVSRVLSWLDDGASQDVGQEWSDPLIDWVFDVGPADDVVGHFAAAEDAFNRKALCAITAAGQSTGGWCWCAYNGDINADDTGKDHGVRHPAAHCDGLCAWRYRQQVASFGSNPNGKCSYTDTYRALVLSFLARTPLTVSARHILAVETLYPLFGDRGRGVEALVRALYACEPLRKGIIAPAQLALAERALSTPLA
ncbi:hypothetical protein pkur_cds_695 [Pandoravirus kuranda]|uniref:Uncharacterized protein n=1 Tax=Pandoravirus kuranda TaxID=3019033 RepID=A0AA95EEA5_9VIRU|nr:hypothetical protein pkur_cds_695 [Pandoravirus kuranda]